MKEQFNGIINDIEHTKQYIECSVNSCEENVTEIVVDRYEMLSLHDRLDNAGIALADLRDEVIEAVTPHYAIANTNIEALTDSELIKACQEIWVRSDGIYPEDSSSMMRVIYCLYQGTYSMRTIEQLVTREAVKRFKGLVKLLMTDHPTEFIDMRR